MCTWFIYGSKRLSRGPLTSKCFHVLQKFIWCVERRTKETELLTVEPVVIVGFSADVMLAAALDGCPEDRSVGSHEIDRGTRVQIPV